MPRPKRDTYELYFRLSDEGFAAITSRAAAAGLTASELVEQVVDRYLDRTLDGQMPLHSFAMPHELRLRKFTISAALGRRIERFRTLTNFGQQDLGRAAVTAFLHVL